jgi:predicted transcriptional regulator of viral defense system
MSGLSKKEIEIISMLELNEKFFFTRDDIRRFFKNDNEMNVYIHRLIKKGRIIKLNKTKYYLIPIRAFRGHWSEHPFIVIDEIFNGKDYYISGMAAAHYWGLIEQIPTQIEVRCTKKQGIKKIFNFTIIFKRVRSLSAKDFVKRKIKGHSFLIASKRKVEEWLKSK